jgi:hypothetical protein
MEYVAFANVNVELPRAGPRTRESIACCKLTVEHSKSIMLYNLMSSAKSFIETVSMHATVISLTYIQNRIGPKTV